MKSLHIFQIIVIEKKKKRNSKSHFGKMKGQKPPWNVKSQGSNVTQRSPWNSIYVTFSFERRVETSLLILVAAQLMRANYSPHSFESIQLSVVKEFVSLISYCS